MRKLTGLTNSEIGEVVEMKYTAVSMAGNKMEEEIRRNSELRKEVDDIVCSFEV